VNAVNRLLVIVLGLVALAAGVLGALASAGGVDPDDVDAVIPFRDAWDRWNDVDWQQAVPRWSLLAAAIVVGLLAAVLLIREIAPRRPAGPDHVVVERSARGETRLSLAAVRRGAEREARAADGVARADLDRLAVEDGAARARFRVRAGEDAHLPTLGAAVADRAGASLGAMLGRPPAEITVVMEVRHDRRRTETRETRRVE
jgi:hypothetical protein